MSILSAAVLVPAVPPVLQAIVAAVVDGHGYESLGVFLVLVQRSTPISSSLTLRARSTAWNMLCTHVANSSQGSLSYPAHFSPHATRSSLSLIMPSISSGGYNNGFREIVFISWHRLRHRLSSPMPPTFTVPSGTIPHSRGDTDHSLRDPSFKALANSMMSVMRGERASAHAAHHQSRRSSSSETGLLQYGQWPVGRSPLACALATIQIAPARAPRSKAMSSFVSQVAM